MPVLSPQPLYPQLRCLNLQTINDCPTLDMLFTWIILVKIAPFQQITPSLLHYFVPLGSSTLSSFYPALDKLFFHSCTIITPLAAQLLHQFIPSEQIAPSLYTVLPHLADNSYIILPPQSYIVLEPISEECQSRTHNLCTLSCVALTSRPSMLVQLLTVFIWIILVRIALSQQITQSLLHHFTPSEQITPSLFTILPHLAAQLLAHFTPLWTNYPFTLTPF